MISFLNFYRLISKNHLYQWLETLPTQIAIWQKSSLNKQFKQWNKVVESLPEIKPYRLDLLHSVTAKSKEPLHYKQKLNIERLMRKLIPWRKGPFFLYGLNIDTEWRSDWKWNRIFPHLSDLTGRTILDVGCGSGYHLWRMIGAGANLAIGIDPTKLFFYQFEAIRKLLGKDQRIHLLPLSIEQLPKISVFDTVFSMGVLYHRRSPLEHLFQLKKMLVKNGELVIETLVIKGDQNTVLVPNSCYAKMCNVYFIPSVLALKNWLLKCGFVNIRIVNICKTTIKEQRKTEWMTGESLIDFLDSTNRNRTVEGYPAPIRASLIATKP